MPVHRHALISTIVAVLATAATATSASAATVTLDGSRLVYTAAPGEKNSPHFTDDAGGESDKVVLLESDAPVTSVPDACIWLAPGQLECTVPGLSGVRAALGDGDDALSLAWEFPAVALAVDAGAGGDRIWGGERAGSAATLIGGPGADLLVGGPEADALDGGDGADELRGRAGADVLDGGAGDDLLGGYAGDDRLQGGAGDDRLNGDDGEATGRDVIDGGPGYDVSDADYTSRRFDAVDPPIVLTLAGGADDGRPGEGDDLQRVERLVEHVASTITGTDAAEHLEVFQDLGPSRLRGMGGDDVLKSSGGPDVLDGGAGDDAIDAGFGDDTVIGGPGRDRISADLAGGDCGPLWCTLPYGNDTVDARDSEADSVTCGAGTDTVRADAIDVVAPDCETVERGGPATPAANSSPGAKAGASGTPGKAGGVDPRRCTVPKVAGLRVAVARRRVRAAGCRVRLRGTGRRVRRQSIRPGRRVAARTIVVLSRGGGR